MSEENGISVLIPTYNRVCVELVSELHRQASILGGIPCEIIVADDASTDKETVEDNRSISSLEGCRFLERPNNVGRARIRNFLAREARYRWVLFIDSGMTVRSHVFLANYLDVLRKLPQQENGMFVLYGGYSITHAREVNPDQPLDHNLRYQFESRSLQNGNAALRQRHPYRDFHTSNFLASKITLLRYPLDERFLRYGYEDVLWGITLERVGVPIHHVDNPVSFEKYETNRAFLEKTEEGLCTLHQFREELGAGSRLVAMAERLKRTGVAYPLVRWTYSLASLHIKARLTGGKPSLFLFNVYKLIYYIHLDFQSR